MKSRNHFYVYTVEVRRVEIVNDINGLPRRYVFWDEVVVSDCCNIHEVCGKLRRHLDDVRYKHKEVVR